MISDMDKSIMSEIAANAMNDLIKILQTNDPLWMDIKPATGVDRLISRPNSFFNNPNIVHVEASRHSGVVIMNALALVDMIMDAVGLDQTCLSSCSSLPYLSGHAIIHNQEANKRADITFRSNRPSSTKKSDVAEENSKETQMTGMMSIQDTAQIIHYSTCPKCQQPTMAHGNEEFNCNSCKEDEIAVPRCKVVVQLEDDTRRISATLFDRCTEKLLESTAVDIHNMDSKGTKALIDMANQKLSKKKIKAEIRASEKKYNDQKTRYTVQDWTETEMGSKSLLDEANTTKQLEDTPEKQEQKRPREITATTSTETTCTTDLDNPTKTEAAILKKVKLEFPDHK